MTLTRATAAFDQGKYSEAAAICLDVLDHQHTSMPAVVLLTRALLAGGSYMAAITAAAAPTLDAKLGAKAGPYREQIEDLLVDAILGWAAAIEAGTAPKADRKSFVEATTFYAENYERFVNELIGLERAIAKRVPVGDTFREMVEAKRGAGPAKAARSPKTKAPKKATKKATTKVKPTAKPAKAKAKAKAAKPAAKKKRSKS